MSDDWALGQNLVDVRNEERAWRNGRTLQPPREAPQPTAPPPKPSDARQSVTSPALSVEISMCTEDKHCRAPADEHFDGCPVERRLREEFGY